MNQLLNTQLLNKITEQAKQSPRLRMNYNLHAGPDAKAQRLFNVLEPGTELPIHRHMKTDETYILVRGKLRVDYYNNKKELTDSIILDPLTENFGLHVPAGQWHTVESLESGTTIFEVKDGPYAPLSPEDIMA
ncbi:MAG: WbuC family cupin fold metalloprotein [Porphyromonadaceae bacterium]|nr:WbuC family cupin fold metalloprotein [Porphyromonadaceae bacterium]